jgi:hypothetical protein
MDKTLEELAVDRDEAKAEYWADVKARALDEVLVRIKTLKADLAAADALLKALEQDND